MSNRVDKIFVCETCGNEVRMEKDGGGHLICCGHEMKEKTENED